MTALSSKDRLLQRIADRSAHVGIVGIGYVGLPLAAVFGAAGLRVTGLDASAERVAAINARAQLYRRCADRCSGATAHRWTARCHN